MWEIWQKKRLCASQERPFSVEWEGWVDIQKVVTCKQYKDIPGVVPCIRHLGRRLYMVAARARYNVNSCGICHVQRWHRRVFFHYFGLPCQFSSNQPLWSSIILSFDVKESRYWQRRSKTNLKENYFIIIYLNCKWVFTRWQWYNKTLRQ
jgi:hypothetical protein